MTLNHNVRQKRVFGKAAYLTLTAKRRSIRLFPSEDTPAKDDSLGSSDNPCPLGREYRRLVRCTTENDEGL